MPCYRNVCPFTISCYAGRMRTMKQELGAFLRQVRRDANLTQAAVAETIGVDQTYVSKIERGISSPSWKYLAGFANVLGTSPIELLRRAGLLENVSEEQEREIGDMIAASPEFAELFETWREISRSRPEKLKEIVSFAKWILQGEGSRSIF